MRIVLQIDCCWVAKPLCMMWYIVHNLSKAFANAVINTASCCCVTALFPLLFTSFSSPLALPCLFRSLLCCAALTIIKDWGNVDLSKSLTFYSRWLSRLITLMRTVITVEKSNDWENFELRIKKIMFSLFIGAWAFWLIVRPQRWWGNNTFRTSIAFGVKEGKERVLLIRTP